MQATVETLANKRVRNKREAAEFLGVSTRTLDRLAAEGKIKRTYFGPAIPKFLHEDLEEFLAKVRGKQA